MVLCNFYVMIVSCTCIATISKLINVYQSTISSVLTKGNNITVAKDINRFVFFNPYFMKNTSYSW